MKQIIIEIGANTGSDTEQLAKKGLEVFALEPIPEFAKLLRRKFRLTQNVTIIEKAVDLINGTRDFNISRRGDWGCSSLHKFNEEIEKVWPGRKDFVFDETIKVETIRGEDLLSEISENPVSIRYLHVDTQGNDLNTLKSFGEKLKWVEEGQCEAANKVNLYQGVDNSLKSIVAFLEENNFDVYQIYANDPDSNEVNVKFRRKR